MILPTVLWRPDQPWSPSAFVGANLLQSGVSCFCPLELILKKLGVKSAAQGA